MPTVRRRRVIQNTVVFRPLGVTAHEGFFFKTGGNAKKMLKIAQGIASERENSTTKTATMLAVRTCKENQMMRVFFKRKTKIGF